jgi:predicted MPP superfamily phosphohydrolase
LAKLFKKGLDYFSHDTGMCEDYKMKLLIAKYKANGYAIYNHILELSYKENGFYFKKTDDNIILIGFLFSIDTSQVNEVIDYMLEKGLFSKELYEKYSILTSERMQINYIAGCEQRKKLFINNKYLLVNIEDYKTNKSKFEIINNGFYEEKNGVKGDKSGINSQKEKEKETVKEKESNTLFNKFWDLYDKKVGSKEKIFKKFLKLTNEEIELLLTHVPKYVQSTPEKKYRKNPETYINNKSWNDEIITNYKVPEQRASQSQQVHSGVKM